MSESHRAKSELEPEPPLAPVEESYRDRLIRALSPPAKRGAPGRSPLCLSLSDLARVAAWEALTPEQTYHIRHCRACRIAVEAVRDEPGAYEDAMPGSTKEMPERRIAAEALVLPILRAIRNAIAERADWSLQGSWALLEFLKKYADETGLMDPFTRRRCAAEYAELVERAPEPMKVVLVYGLVRLKDSRRFAMNVAREIAGRDDALAHRILVYVLLSEAAELKTIDSVRWEELAAGARPFIAGHRHRVELAMVRFLSAVKPPHTLREAAAVLRKDAGAFAATMFAERDASSTLLHLLAIREYLGRVARYVHETHSDLIDCFPDLVAILHAGVRENGGALLLAMEAAEKLRPASPIESLIQKLIQFEKLPQPQPQRDTALRAKTN
jgi:hypothetical protein